MIRLEDLGGDNWEVDDTALRVVAARSGDVVALGDRLMVEIIDAAILRRTVYAKRAGVPGGDRRKQGRHETPKKLPKHVQQRKLDRAGRKEKKVTGSRRGKKGRRR
jgi:hypothetical protein